MSEPLTLSCAAELDTTVYQCPICGEKLRRRKSPRTNWQWHYFAEDGRRHYATRCNFSKKQEVDGND